jgi:3-deoxy-manno-octulosonate cytidylyltransferase (CMP-KDO synthetase)
VTRVLAVIPARWASSRFPGKALADLAGAPLVVRVAERAVAMETVDEVVVATDDARILEVVRAAGYACELTGDHPTGTDRVAEVAARRPADLVLNLQGDEPLLDPADADRLVRAMLAEPEVAIGTLAHPFADAAAWREPHQVKVLVDRRDHALYFSRAGIPGVFPGRDADPGAGWRHALRHVGIYAFRAAALRRLVELPPGPLEASEGLEQLRALENGLSIKVVRIARGPVGVDTPGDLERVRRLWADAGRD